MSAVTLREKLRETERQIRELVQHLELGQLPKVHALRKLAKQGMDPEEMSEVADASIRNSTTSVLKSHEYTIEMQKSLNKFLKEIQADLKRITEGG